MIFIDSNIPMYRVGAEHPNKQLARLELERAVESDQHLVTDAEALQEILHRYKAINRFEPARRRSAAWSMLFIRFEEEDALEARRLLSNGVPSARDAIHVAVMQRHGIDQILRFDRGFDAVPGLTRIGG